MSELMTKHEMTEEDIKLQYITPAIESAGWDKLKQIKMEYNFTDGRVIVRGKCHSQGKEKAHRLSALLQAQYSFGYRRGKG